MITAAYLGFVSGSCRLREAFCRKPCNYVIAAAHLGFSLWLLQVVGIPLHETMLLCDTSSSFKFCLWILQVAGNPTHETHQPGASLAARQLRYLKIGAAAVGGGALLAITGVHPSQGGHTRMGRRGKIGRGRELWDGVICTCVDLGGVSCGTAWGDWRVPHRHPWRGGG